MKIICQIDRREAMKLGVNAEKWVELDVDPATLPQEERDLLADRLQRDKGHSPDALVFSSIVEPTVEGLRKALQNEIAHKRAREQDRAANVRREKDSFRAMLRDLENGEFYDRSLPLRKRNGYEWDWSPNYSRDDPEAQRLWQRVDRLRRSERERVLSEIDAALQRDDVSTRTLLREACSWDLATQRRLVPNALKFHEEEQEAAERARNEAAEREAAKRRAFAEREAAKRRAFVAQHGTPDQVERYDADVLPSAEFSALARGALFEAFWQFARYDPLRADDVVHRENCVAPEPKFRSEVHDELSSSEWERLKQIRAAAPKDAEIAPRRSVAWCGCCGEDDDDNDVTRSWARVTRSLFGEDYRIWLKL